PVADLLLLGGGAAEIAECLFIFPALLLRFAQAARAALWCAISALGEFGFHGSKHSALNAQHSTRDSKRKSVYRGQPPPPRLRRAKEDRGQMSANVEELRRPNGTS